MCGAQLAQRKSGRTTARPLKSGTQFKSFGNTTSGWGSGQSLDQYLATKLAPPTTFKSLQLGVHVRDTEVRARISYAAADQPKPPREDPKDVFSALFGNTTVQQTLFAIPTVQSALFAIPAVHLWALATSVALWRRSER